VDVTDYYDQVSCVFFFTTHTEKRWKSYVASLHGNRPYGIQGLILVRLTPSPPVRKPWFQIQRKRESLLVNFGVNGRINDGRNSIFGTLGLLEGDHTAAVAVFFCYLGNFQPGKETVSVVFLDLLLFQKKPWKLIVFCSESTNIRRLPFILSY